MKHKEMKNELTSFHLSEQEKRKRKSRVPKLKSKLIIFIDVINDINGINGINGAACGALGLCRQYESIRTRMNNACPVEQSNQ